MTHSRKAPIVAGALALLAFGLAAQAAPVGLASAVAPLTSAKHCPSYKLFEVEAAKAKGKNVKVTGHTAHFDCKVDIPFVQPAKKSSSITLGPKTKIRAFKSATDATLITVMPSAFPAYVKANGPDGQRIYRLYGSATRPTRIVGQYQS